MIPPVPGARLAGKVVLVAGAGSSAAGWSIGKASCVTLARQGAAIIALDADLAAAEDAAHEVERAGGKALPVQADVADADAMQAAVDTARGHYGRIDVLQANAGIGKVGGPEDIDLADWDRIQRVNVTSLLIATRLLAPLMRAQGGGCIVNTASTAGLRPRPGLTWYNASKGAVITMTKSMAAELGPDNIRVNALCPVAGDTPLLPSFLGANTREAFEATVPLGRLSTSEDVAKAALWLASDEASFITGVALEVDGGRCV